MQAIHVNNTNQRTSSPGITLLLQQHVAIALDVTRDLAKLLAPLSFVLFISKQRRPRHTRTVTVKANKTLAINTRNPTRTPASSSLQNHSLMQLPHGSTLEETQACNTRRSASTSHHVIRKPVNPHIFSTAPRTTTPDSDLPTHFQFNMRKLPCKLRCNLALQSRKAHSHHVKFTLINRLIKVRIAS